MLLSGSLALRRADLTLLDLGWIARHLAHRLQKVKPSAIYPTIRERKTLSMRTHLLRLVRNRIPHLWLPLRTRSLTHTSAPTRGVAARLVRRGRGAARTPPARHLCLFAFDGRLGRVYRALGRILARGGAHTVAGAGEVGRACGGRTDGGNTILIVDRRERMSTQRQNNVLAEKLQTRKKKASHKEKWQCPSATCSEHTRKHRRTERDQSHSGHSDLHARIAVARLSRRRRAARCRARLARRRRTRATRGRRMRGRRRWCARGGSRCRGGRGRRVWGVASTLLLCAVDERGCSLIARERRVDGEDHIGAAVATRGGEEPDRVGAVHL